MLSSTHRHRRSANKGLQENYFDIADDEDEPENSLAFDVEVTRLLSLVDVSAAESRGMFTFFARFGSLLIMFSFLDLYFYLYF